MKILHAKNNNVERIAKYESYIKCLNVKIKIRYVDITLYKIN